MMLVTSTIAPHVEQTPTMYLQCSIMRKFMLKADAHTEHYRLASLILPYSTSKGVAWKRMLCGILK